MSALIISSTNVPAVDQTASIDQTASVGQTTSIGQTALGNLPVGDPSTALLPPNSCFSVNVIDYTDPLVPAGITSTIRAATGIAKRPLEDVLNEWAGNPLNRLVVNKILECIEKESAELNLSGLELQSLPEIFDYPELQHLQKLHLNSNSISRLPKSIFQLKNLQHLDLRGNQLEAQHDFSRALPNLKVYINIPGPASNRDKLYRILECISISDRQDMDIKLGELKPEVKSTVIEHISSWLGNKVAVDQIEIIKPLLSLDAEHMAAVVQQTNSLIRDDMSGWEMIDIVQSVRDLPLQHIATVVEATLSFVRSNMTTADIVSILEALNRLSLENITAVVGILGLSMRDDVSVQEMLHIVQLVGSLPLMDLYTVVDSTFSFVTSNMTTGDIISILEAVNRLPLERTNSVVRYARLLIRNDRSAFRIVSILEAVNRLPLECMNMVVGSARVCKRLMNPCRFKKAGKLELSF